MAFLDHAATAAAAARRPLVFIGPVPREPELVGLWIYRSDGSRIGTAGVPDVMVDRWSAKTPTSYLWALWQQVSATLQASGQLGQAEPIVQVAHLIKQETD